MTLYALTGTPGSGKTTLAAELRSRGYDAIDGKQFIIGNGLMGDFDPGRDTHEVDPDALNDALSELASDEDIHIFESHLAHLVDCRAIIVLRCAPSVLAERLRARGYPEAKVLENVQSEILDVILCEAMESDIPVYEVPCTDMGVGPMADAVEAILKGEVGDYLPGKTDWSEEMERWF